MTFEKLHCGTIRNAELIELGEDRSWVEGRIYDQPFERFPEGSYIHTSRIVKVEGNEIETLNSRYTVEWAKL